jgi:hypothetical protein
MRYPASNGELSDSSRAGARRRHARAMAAAGTAQIGPILNALGLSVGLLLIWATICVL